MWDDIRSEVEGLGAKMLPEEGGAEREVSARRRPNGVSGQRAPMTPPLLFILGMIKAIQTVKITIFVFHPFRV